MPSDTNGCTAHDAPLVYVDVIDLSNAPTDPDLQFYEDAWEQFQEDMRSALPKSFVPASESDKRAFALSRDTNPLFSNALCFLVVDAQGESHHQGIAFVPRHDAPAFVWNHIAEVSKKLFDELATMYHLSVRNCAWTSRPYPIQPKSPAEIAAKG
jgi:hypothetical protein